MQSAEYEIEQLKGRVVHLEQTQTSLATRLSALETGEGGAEPSASEPETGTEAQADGGQGEGSPGAE
jgi:hypothetical protein